MNLLYINLYDKSVAILNNRISSLYLKENDLNEIFSLIKINDDALKNFQKLVRLKIDEVFKKYEKIKLLECVNFEKITIYIVYPMWKIGFKIIFNLNSFNKVIKEDIFDKTSLNENKNIGIKEDVKEKVKEKIKEEQKEVIKDNELKIINELRKEYDLNEKDFSNLYLIKVLRKYNYDKVKTFAKLFE